MAAPARYINIPIEGHNYRIVYQDEKPSDALEVVNKIAEVLTNPNFKYRGEDEYAKLPLSQLWDVLADKAEAIRGGYTSKCCANRKVVRGLDNKLEQIRSRIRAYAAEREEMAKLNQILIPRVISIICEYLPFGNDLQLADVMYTDQGESGTLHLAEARRKAARKIGYRPSNRGDNSERFIEGLHDNVRNARNRGYFRELNLQPTDGGGEFLEKLMALPPEQIGNYLAEFPKFPALFRWLQANFEIPPSEAAPLAEGAAPPADDAAPPADDVQQFRFGGDILHLHTVRVPVGRRHERIEYHVEKKDSSPMAKEPITGPAAPSPAAPPPFHRDEAATGGQLLVRSKPITGLAAEEFEDESVTGTASERVPLVRQRKGATGAAAPPAPRRGAYSS